MPMPTAERIARNRLHGHPVTYVPWMRAVEDQPGALASWYTEMGRVDLMADDTVTVWRDGRPVVYAALALVEA